MRREEKIKKYLKRYVELTETIKKLEKEKDELKKYLNERIDNEIIIPLNNDYNVKAYIKETIKTQIDRKKLETEYPDIFEKVKKIIKSNYLEIRKVKAGK